MTKLCKDCLHSENSAIYWCNHPNVGIRVVDGTPDSRLCSINRKEAGLVYTYTCGLAGNWYKAKPVASIRQSFWKEIWRILKLK